MESPFGFIQGFHQERHNEQERDHFDEAKNAVPFDQDLSIPPELAKRLEEMEAKEQVFE
jgi:hypothetical protein